MSAGRPPVVVLGDVMTDVVAVVEGPLAHASDTPARIVMRPGGSGANTAAWLGSLGARAVFVGRVGDDDAGRAAEAALREAGVEPLLSVAPGASTGACVVLVDASGERTMLPDAGANALLSADDLPDAAFVAGGHLHVSGYTLLRPSTRDAALTALRRAREAGMGTSVDPASAAPLAEAGAGLFRDLVAGVGLLFVTLDEAEVLCGTRDPETVATALRAAHPEVVVKLGGDGALWRGPAGGAARVPAAPPPGPVVDTTGAGDAFAAAWLATRAAGADPEAALAAACSRAASVVTRPGARP
ncbi:MAG: carbohydrate kinase family protein [Thermoleophilia bacterium]